MCISERVNFRVTNIYQKENIPALFSYRFIHPQTSSLSLPQQHEAYMHQERVSRFQHHIFSMGPGFSLGEKEEKSASPSPLLNPPLCSLRSQMFLLIYPIYCIFFPTAEPGPRRKETAVYQITCHCNQQYIGIVKRHIVVVSLSCHRNQQYIGIVKRFIYDRSSFNRGVKSIISRI